MKNSELKATIDTLESMDTQFPVKVSFIIAKNIRKLKEALEIYNAEHDRLIRKYAADGEQIKPTDDVKAFAAELVELNNLDAGISFKKIKYEDIEGITLTVQQAGAIVYMMED